MLRPSTLAAAVVLAAAMPTSVYAQSTAPTSARSDTLRLSLVDAVERALRVGDEAKLAAAATDIADAQVGAARANGLPQLRINSGYTHTYESARGQAVGSVFNQPNTYTSSLSLSQPIYQGGRVIAASRAASAVENASRMDEAETRAMLNVNVQRAYLSVLLDERLVTIEDSNLVLSAARVKQVEQLQAAGRAARYDVLTARVEYTNLEPVAIQARNTRDLAVLELKRLTNIPLDQPVALTTGLDEGTVRALLSSLTPGADSLARADRPALRSAELNVTARRQGITIARADYLPSASISVQTGYQAFPPLGYGFPSRLGATDASYCPAGSAAGRVCQNGGWFSDRSLAATISIPVFDGLRTRSNVELARAQAHMAEVQLQQTRENVAIEVAKARAEVERARSAFEAQSQNVSEAQEAFQLASLRFARGLSTQLEVSDAQLALLTAQVNAARATYDVYLAAAELARSLGRPIPFPSGSAAPNNHD